MAETSVDGPSAKGALHPAPSTAEQPGTPLPPLAVTGLVVTKADLIRALQVYVPQLSDISALDDDRYLLHLPASAPGEGDLQGEDHD